jgi:hypothetical protein
MDLAFLIHRIATDEQFAVQFQNDPYGTIRRNGLTLETESLQAIIRLTRKPGLLEALLKNVGNSPDDPLNWAIHSLRVTTSNECAP